MTISAGASFEYFAGTLISEELHQPNKYLSGGNGGGVPRVPIPNTTVKPSSADGTWTEGSWESRTLPGGCMSEQSTTVPEFGRGSATRAGPVGVFFTAVGL